MRALVTGASGFVGRILCDRLVRDGISVRAGVRSSAEGVRCDEVVVLGDLDANTPWHAALAGVDVVFHLAALAHEVGPSAAESRYAVVNADATGALARAVEASGVRRLVFLECTSSPRDAIAREKQIKRWTRAKKVALIEANNPQWVDLA